MTTTSHYNGNLRHWHDHPPSIGFFCLDDDADGHLHHHYNTAQRQSQLRRQPVGFFLVTNFYFRILPLNNDDGSPHP